MGKTLYGDAFIELGMEWVDCGEPQKLHDIFDWAREHGAKPLKVSHPLNVFQRVLNALDRDDRFEKSFINYSGIYKQPVRVFTLRKELGQTSGRLS